MKVIIDDKEVHKAVLEIFEKGDDNFQNIYHESSKASNEWKLCKKIATGRRETYFANDPAINKLVELGIVINVEGYCHISARLYKRQILKIYFEQEYLTVIDAFPGNERLLFNISCLQKILLNEKVERLVLIRIEQLMQKEIQTEDKIATELARYLDTVLKDQNTDLDMEEIHTYIDYYSMEPIEHRKQVLLVLTKAFICRFKEVTAAE